MKTGELNLPVAKEPMQFLYQDVKLQHLNPGYQNKELDEFIKYYKPQKGVILETFEYNEKANEENFIIEMAYKVRNIWLAGNTTPLTVFRQFNKTRNNLLTMYFLKI